jgi:uncharacterized protein (TIGR04255 family)
VITLPPVELTHLPDAPLTLAVAQIRFRTVLSIEQADRVASFQSALGERYEFIDRQTTQTIRVMFGDKSIDSPQTPAPETVWRFRELANNWIVSLSSSSVALEAQEYKDFESFSTEFMQLVGLLSAEFGPKTQTRIGLRYVNELVDERLRDGDFEAVLNGRLLGPIVGDLRGDLLSSLSDLRFQQADGVLAIRHGLVREETYLLDLDYFLEEDMDFALGDIHERLNGYHQLIESLFVWALNPGYLDSIGGGENPG